MKVKKRIQDPSPPLKWGRGKMNPHRDGGDRQVDRSRTQQLLLPIATEGKWERG